ncbi:MAG: homocitrate synthase [Deltaproteobacteria bacterium]|jgi:homocitrate synthase NifV|nr:homocitrate synthase [Deltaproteobacteria bacterium]
MPRRIRIVDSTLRDGHQSPGLAIPLGARLSLAKALEAAGVDRVEAGFPGMGECETEAVRAIKGVLVKAEVSAWNRLNLADVSASISAGVDLVHICFPLSERQMGAKLGMGFARAASLLGDAVGLSRDAGIPCSVGLEDVSRSDEGRIRKAMGLLASLGVEEVRLADTVGVLAPLSVRWLVGLFAGEGFKVGFHAHNDLGLACANSLVAALSGAGLVDTTLGGIGERAGNAPLAGFLKLASHAPGLSFGVSLEAAQEIERGFLPLLGREDFLMGLSRSRASDITDMDTSEAGLWKKAL